MIIWRKISNSVFLGYDSHVVIDASSKLPPDLYNKSITVIPFNTEKFRSIKIGCYDFKDSYAALPFSLSKLGKNLLDRNNNFNILRQSNITKSGPLGGKFFDPVKFEYLRQGKGCT